MGSVLMAVSTIVSFSLDPSTAVLPTTETEEAALSIHGVAKAISG